LADGNLLFLCKTSDLQPGSVKRVDRAEGDLAVYNIDGEFYATEDRCSHGLASLAEGDLIGEEIECTMHFGSFNAKTGEPMAPPCSIPIKTYKVEVQGDDVFAVIG
jgi:ethylbenzene dioxygenase ferredoxin subunit